MSFFSDASLVLVPSGIKDSKVYSIKPTDGSGDLTFTRNSNATRIGPDGKLEKVRQNLLLQSNDFSSASWSKINNVSVSATRVADPFGGTTAWQIIYDGTTDGRLEQTVSGFSGTGTQSVWLRVSSGTQEVKIGATSGSLTTSVVTTTWTRFSATTTSGNFPRILCNASTTIEAYGCQFEASDFGPTQYIPTTSAAVSVGPTANVPRLDYSGGASCPSLLLEPQTTALNLYSESFDNAYWSLSRISAFGSGSVANAVTAPDGTQSAEYVQQATGQTSGGGAFRVILLSTGNYTISVFAKKAEQRYLRLGGALAAGGSSLWCNFDLETGTIGTPDAGVTPKIENYENGWFRCSITANKVDLTGQNVFFYQANTLNGSDATPLSGLYLWGANVTQTSYLQSYVPTLGASVTRLADAAYKTGISSLIGQTEGTIFLDFELQTTNQDMVVMNIYDAATPVNSIYFYVTGSNRLQAYSDNSGTQAAILSGVLTQGRYKAAFAYKANDFAFYLNGSLVGVDASGTVPTCSALRLENYANIPTYQEKTAVNQAILFKTRLTNAQLAELTTL